jgi:hypothetical protein
LILRLEESLAEEDIPGGVAVRDGEFLSGGNLPQRTDSDVSIFEENGRVRVARMIDE